MKSSQLNPARFHLFIRVTVRFDGAAHDEGSFEVFNKRLWPIRAYFDDNANSAVPREVAMFALEPSQTPGLSPAAVAPLNC